MARMIFFEKQMVYKGGIVVGNPIHYLIILNFCKNLEYSMAIMFFFSFEFKLLYNIFLFKLHKILVV